MCQQVPPLTLGHGVGSGEWVGVLQVGCGAVVVWQAGMGLQGGGEAAVGGQAGLEQCCHVELQCVQHT